MEPFPARLAVRVPPRNAPLSAFVPQRVLVAFADPTTLSFLGGETLHCTAKRSKAAAGRRTPGRRFAPQLITLLLLAGAAFPLAATAALPPIPELPSSGYPAVSTSEPFARALVAHVTPAELEETLVTGRELIPPVLRNLGSGLMTSDLELRQKLVEYLAEMAGTHAKRIAPTFRQSDLPLLVSILLVDPLRWMEDPQFRERATSVAEQGLEPVTPRALRESCLRELNEVLGADFATSERLAAAWGLVPRRSAERESRFKPSELAVSDDASSRITASVLSLNTSFFTPEESRHFLSALRAAAPLRRIVVLGDAPMRAATEGLNVDFVDTFGRPFTPWPRDPFILARDREGTVLVNRPNEQPDREDDSHMARALAQALPDNGPWKHTRWAVAPVPFHNGHVLQTKDAAWISIHSVEIRALEILGISSVPVDTFGTKEGIERYLSAVRSAAAELEPIYRKPVRFVHPLDADPALMQMLGGGAGYDLDSLLTILPRTDGSLGAIVADAELGAELARTAVWDEARAAYGISGDALPARDRTSMMALQQFLDIVASYLKAGGVAVRRMPLIQVPASSVSKAPKDFLLTWNNVVLEPGRAEGFASLLREGDQLAKKVFSDLGYNLTLYPPLIRSVVLSGGYRCASNHLR